MPIGDNSVCGFLKVDQNYRTSVGEYGFGCEFIPTQIWTQYSSCTTGPGTEWMCVCIHIYIQINIYSSVYIYIYVYSYRHTCVYTYIFIQMDTYSYVCTYRCIFMYIHMCMCISKAGYMIYSPAFDNPQSNGRDKHDNKQIKERMMHENMPASCIWLGQNREEGC